MRQPVSRASRVLAGLLSACVGLGAACERSTDALELVGTLERTRLELTAPVSERIVAIEGPGSLDCSEETAKAIDAEVRQLLADAYADALRILSAARAVLDRVAEELLRRETITGDEFRAWLRTEPG